MNLPLTPIRFLLWAADEYGAKIGVVDGEKRFTYRQLADRAARLAATLRGLGVEDGDRVATLSFNCHPLLEAYYGVPMARAVLLSLNVRLAAEEQAYILKHSGSKVAIFDPEFLPLIEQLQADQPEIRWVSLHSHPDLPAWVHPQTYEQLLEAAQPESVDFTTYDENAIAELFYTSGSTGRPKGVMLSHRTLHLHALTCLIGTYRRGHRQPADQQVELHTIPLFHANGWGKAHTVTLTGGRHVMVKRFEPAHVLELIEQEKATGLCAVPTMATALVNCPELERYDISSLEEIMLGGAASSPSLVEELEAKLNCSVFAGYGLTETSPVAMIAHVKDTLGDVSDEERIRRQAMTGFSFPGVETRVADADGNNVPKDMKTIGEILFRGDIVMDGYWNEPEATAEVVRDNWLRTGGCRSMGRAQLLPHCGPPERRHHQRRREYLVDRDREGDRCAPRGLRNSRGGGARREVGRSTQGLRRPQARRHGIGGRYQEPRPRALGGIQSAEVRGVPGRATQGATGKILKRALRDPHWEGMEKHVHGSGRG